MNKVWQQWTLVIAVVAVVVVGVYLFIQSRQPEIIIGQYPVKQYEISKDDSRAFLTVIGADNSQMTDLVNMSYFSPLRSGVTQKEAVEQLGIPSNIRETSGGSKVMEFQQKGYRLDVILETYEEGEEFLLETNPADVSVYDVLPAYITDKISTKQDQSTVTIDSGGKTVFVFVEGTRVASMQWRDYD